ncbi:MAG: anti-sigma factor family protein [Hyphomicrobium sp.]
MSNPTQPERPSDEELVAFADGALEPDASARIDRYLATDADARAFVDALRMSATLARSAFDDVLSEAPPPALIEAIRGPSGGETGSPSGNVVPLASRRRERRPELRFALSMAACLTLILAGAMYVRNIPGPGDAGLRIAVGPVERQSVVATLLESKVSGDPATTTAGGANRTHELIVTATFIDRQGRPCREFELAPVAPATGDLTVAVACRADEARWVVEGMVVQSAGKEQPGTSFSPAGGDSHAEIDSVLSRLGAKPALSPSDERALLDRGWR